jgi:hypothetical protein
MKLKPNFDRVLDLLGRLPTTQARMVTTLAIILGTAVRYWSSITWIPSDAWLVFLGSLSGVDVAHFASKRLTWKDRTQQTTEEPVVEEENVTKTTDVSELSQEPKG